MLFSPNNTYKFGHEASERPYLPSFVLPIFNRHELFAEPQAISNYGGSISSGKLPGSSNGGRVILAGQEWGSDFVAVEGDSTKAYLIPADKGDVRVDEPEKNLGDMVRPGVVVISYDDMAIISGLIISCDFLASDYENNGARVSRLQPGLFAVQHQLFGRGIIQDVDSSGVTTITRL